MKCPMRKGKCTRFSGDMHSVEMQINLQHQHVWPNLGAASGNENDRKEINGGERSGRTKKDAFSRGAEKCESVKM